MHMCIACACMIYIRPVVCVCNARLGDINETHEERIQGASCVEVKCNFLPLDFSSFLIICFHEHALLLQLSKHSLP